MSHRPFRRAITAVALAAALSVGGMTAANAAPTTVDDITLTWGLSKEAGGGAYFGGCNFLSAGKAGNAGSSRLWTEADGFYKSSEGNVSIVKDGASGPVTPTWATKCQGANGSAVNTSAASSTNNRVVFSGGSGTVDLDAGTASVSWTGSFSVVFYGGLTYWHASNPTLTVNADGTGTLKATAGGYGASMEDPSQWVPLADQQITLANLTGVSLTEDGFSKTPDYLGVVLSNVTNQVTTGANAGAFPEDYVAFHDLTGQSSYWYSSGGAADPKKPATPLAIAWDVEAGSEPGNPGEPGEPGNPGTGQGEDQGDVDVTVKVPETTEPPVEALKLSVSGSANLGQATASAAGFTASGVLPVVTVTDTRQGGTWSVSGQLGAFSSTSGSIPAAALGWAPTLVAGNAQAGATVAPNAPGLGTAATLGSGAAGESQLSADLSLVAPATTTAGDYTAKLVLTALG
ncbi:MAG TPA: HtaA domain-containing protein [Arachnia sp.]|nr:HtaA domain-containing protein [Arachnia sp.]HMT86106.1 HtaA domain-containing protein [Arachnia sp.]